MTVTAHGNVIILHSDDKSRHKTDRTHARYAQNATTARSVAALAIDKVGIRPYYCRSGPTSGPTAPAQKAKKVKLKSPPK